MEERNTDEKIKLKKLLIGLIVGMTVVLVIIIFAIIKSGKNDRSRETQMPAEMEETDDIMQKSGITDELQAEKEEDREKAQTIIYSDDRKRVSLHLEEYMENIFGGWQWTLQEQIASYITEQNIDAENAVVLLYNGYDAASGTHSFYLQLDDANGTVLLGTYKPYQSHVQPSDKTLEELLKEKESQGDEGEPAGITEEVTTATPAPTETPTPEPTQAPVIRYTDLQVLEVPTELADFLGTDAPSLPGALAGFLTANGEEPESVTCTGEYQISGNTAAFDVKLKNNAVIHVMYNGEYTFEFK